MNKFNYSIFFFKVKIKKNILHIYYYYILFKIKLLKWIKINN